jgi:hypothetical protein
MRGEKCYMRKRGRSEARPGSYTVSGWEEEEEEEKEEKGNVVENKALFFRLKRK